MTSRSALVVAALLVLSSLAVAAPVSGADTVILVSTDVSDRQPTIDENVTVTTNVSNVAVDGDDYILKSVRVFNGTTARDRDELASVQPRNRISPGESKQVDFSVGLDTVGEREVLIKLSLLSTDGDIRRIERVITLDVRDPHPVVGLAVEPTVEGSATNATVTVANGLDEPIRNVELQLSPTRTRLTSTDHVFARFEPGAERAVSVGVRGDTTGTETVTARVAYSYNGTRYTTEQRLSGTFVEPTNPGRISLNNLRVEETDAGLRVRGTASNPGGSAVTGVTVSVAEGDGVDPAANNAEFFVGASPAATSGRSSRSPSPPVTAPSRSPSGSSTSSTACHVKPSELSSTRPSKHPTASRPPRAGSRFPSRSPGVWRCSSPCSGSSAGGSAVGDTDDAQSGGTAAPVETAESASIFGPPTDDEPTAESPLTQSPSQSPDAPLVAARDVVKEYQSGDETHRALRGVDLDISPGEFVAVVGPSGSGKSTLLNVLGLLDVPTRGTVELDGTDVADLSIAERTRLRRETVGFVFQSFHLLPTLTATENVMLPRLAGSDTAGAFDRADRLLHNVGLGDRTDHYPDQLSGGQRQRVAVARSLVNDPRLLLADEPTGNLDQATGRKVLDEFAGIADEGVAIVAVTHDEQVTRFADRVVTIVDGRIDVDPDTETAHTTEGDP